jgi:hypothetical protein
VSEDPWAVLTEEQRAAILAKIRPDLEAIARTLLQIWPDYDFEKTELGRMTQREAQP